MDMGGDETSNWGTDLHMLRHFDGAGGVEGIWRGWTPGSERVGFLVVTLPLFSAAHCILTNDGSCSDTVAILQDDKSWVSVW
jgi:hypothetical protein